LSPIQRDTETKNIILNRATIDELVDAFGEDSADWQRHVLICETEKVIVSDRRVTAVCFVPEGYERVDDYNGYVVVAKEWTQADTPEGLPDIQF
jgi:hypothetical protein